MQNLKSWGLIVRCLLIVFLSATGISVYAYIFGKSPEPNSVAITLTQSEVVADFKFEVRKHAFHWFTMRFGYPENDQVERARVRKLLGGHGINKDGKPTEPGTPTPVRLDIFAICKEGHEVAIHSLDSEPILSSWGDGYFGRNIGSYDLKPGLYRARLFNKRASADFQSIPIDLLIWKSERTTINSEDALNGSDLCQK